MMLSRKLVHIGVRQWGPYLTDRAPSLLTGDMICKIGEGFAQLLPLPPSLELELQLACMTATPGAGKLRKCLGGL